MYTFEELEPRGLYVQQIGMIVANEEKRATRLLKRTIDDLKYQQENSHIFLEDGTINATERNITEITMRIESVRGLLAAITVV